MAKAAMANAPPTANATWRRRMALLPLAVALLLWGADGFSTAPARGWQGASRAPSRCSRRLGSPRAPLGRVVGGGARSSIVGGVASVADAGLMPPSAECRIPLDVSLEHPVLNQQVPLFLRAAGALVAALFTIAIVSRVVLVLQDSRLLENLGIFLGDFQHSMRLWWGASRAWLEGLRLAWTKGPFGPRRVALPDAWTISSIAERERMGSDCLRYRLLLPAAYSVLPLDLGQEVALCALDNTGRVCEASFPLLSPRDARGYVEIAVPAQKREVSSDWRERQEFGRLLDHLALGDEVAIRPGYRTLKYVGEYTPITDVVMIAGGGLGIIPMLQLITGLLPARESSVTSASVVWLNENPADFSLYPDLEELYYKYNRKLDVSCIIERDLYGHQLTSNRQLMEVIQDFQPGTLVAISGPDYFVSKVRDYLVRQRGYPVDCLVVV